MKASTKAEKGKADDKIKNGIFTKEAPMADRGPNAV